MTTTPIDVPTDAPIDRTELLGELEREIGVMLRRIRRVIGERARSVHPELQPSTYPMLTWLHTHGPMRASEIACSFGIDKGAVSRQVQQLLELGLVDRTPDPDDGRATLLSTSEMARARLDELKQARRVWIDHRLGDLSDADLAQFVGLLGRYNVALGS